MTQLYSPINRQKIMLQAKYHLCFFFSNKPPMKDFVSSSLHVGQSLEGRFPGGERQYSSSTTVRNTLPQREHFSLCKSCRGKRTTIHTPPTSEKALKAQTSVLESGACALIISYSCSQPISIRQMPKQL